MPEEKKTPKTEPEKRQKMAAILVRGKAKVRKPIKETLRLLRLNHQNFCVVLDPNPVNLGMLKKAKDYLTWGEIDEATFKELVEKRGEEYQGPETCSRGKVKYQKFFVYQNKKYKKYFRLNPPRQGWGRKGIKLPFKVGGALGYRGEKINELIGRML